MLLPARLQHLVVCSSRQKGLTDGHWAAPVCPGAEAGQPRGSHGSEGENRKEMRKINKTKRPNSLLPGKCCLGLSNTTWGSMECWLHELPALYHRTEVELLKAFPELLTPKYITFFFFFLITKIFLLHLSHSLGTIYLM